MNQELAETLKRASVSAYCGAKFVLQRVSIILWFVRSVCRTFGAARREWTNLYPLEGH